MGKGGQIMQSRDILFENAKFRLIVGGDARAKSLLCLETGEECLAPGEELPLFTVTQERPYNNEVKLSHPNKRTVFPAKSARLEDGRLIVGFSIAPYEAVIRVTVKEDYMLFTLEDFIVHPADYAGLDMTAPPVAEFGLLRLPLKKRENFGAWSNVLWDEKTAVAVMGADASAHIDGEERKDYMLLSADAVKGSRLRGESAALFCTAKEEFLDAVDQFEKDLGLYAGVKSRRSDLINASIYWSADVTPENVDEHIRRAKEGGFRLMLLYYTCLFREGNLYALLGNYDYRAEYPNGRRDLEKMLEKIKAAGILPGFHMLQTHIGVKSRYVTPRADHRLHLTRHFTLAKAYRGEDFLEVEEDPTDTVMADKCRILAFGGELFSYEGYLAERPYRFTGVRRGAHDTLPADHPAGQIGGVLDVSEYGGGSVYLDQESSLADEIAEKLADAYNAGFTFCYFDGSEGVSAPFDYNVPRGQMRVLNKFENPPLFVEGAAKSHFSWHYMSGGNAFDIFPPEIFKAKIGEHPAEEAPRMQKDFTRLNFGWWGFWAPETQADMYEYGTSRAAGWNCPVTIQMSLEKLNAHPRTGDILETMRRWEDVRAKKWLTEEQKEALRDLETEHTLLIDEKGDYSLCVWKKIEMPEGFRAFFIEREKPTVAFWHESGEGKLLLDLPAESLSVFRDFRGDKKIPEERDRKTVLHASDKMYIEADLPADELINALGNAKAI